MMENLSHNLDLMEEVHLEFSPNFDKPVAQLDLKGVTFDVWQWFQ